MSDVKLKMKKIDGGLKPQEQGFKTAKVLKMQFKLHKILRLDYIRWRNYIN